MRASTRIISAQSGSFGDPRLVQTTVAFPFNGVHAPLLDCHGQLVGFFFRQVLGTPGCVGVRHRARSRTPCKESILRPLQIRFSAGTREEPGDYERGPLPQIGRMLVGEVGVGKRVKST